MHQRLALTANVLVGDRQASLAAGMDDHLCKPFTAEEMQAILERWSPEFRSGRAAVTV